MARLGDVAQILRGVTFKPDQLVDESVPDAVVCLRTKNVQIELDWTDVLYVPPSVLGGEHQYVRPGDIIISSANSWNQVGKCAWVGAVERPTTFGGFISNLRVLSEEVDARYLYWWFSNPRTQATVRSFGQQTTNIANLSVSRTLELDLPLPPLPEQRRIASILDEADQLRAAAVSAASTVGQLGESFFRAIFTDLALDDWEAVPLSSVSEVVSGITKGRRTSELTREVPYLTVANVQDRRIRLDVVKTIDATEREIERYRLHSGDILLTEGGDPDKLGRGSVWTGEVDEVIHQNHVFRVRTTDPRIRPEYVSWLMSSERGKKYFASAAKQTTGIASINSTQLRAFPVPIPPIDLQAEFAARLMDSATMIAFRAAHLAKLDELFASLQHRAFRGEL